MSVEAARQMGSRKQRGPLSNNLPHANCGINCETCCSVLFCRQTLTLRRPAILSTGTDSIAGILNCKP